LNEVQEWVAFIKQKGIKRLCCLLSKDQLNYYEALSSVGGLLEVYRKEFGKENICWSEVEDYHLCGINKLKNEILPFLKESDIKKQHVLVHCSGGSGRTGHVLTAWLVFGRGLRPQEALVAVKKMGRNPLEAVNSGNATREQLDKLLKACQEAAGS